MTRRPAFQFYPSDWRNDPGLRLCSAGARGLWIDMMCLMHEGQPYGHLTVFGRPIDDASLARLVGESPTLVRKWVKELGDNEVYSVTANGVVFSRRMVRDEELRERRAAGGQAGAEHGHKGAKYGSKGGRPKKEETPLCINGTGDIKPPLKPAPSTSSSSSGSNEPIASTNVDVSAEADAPLTRQEVIEAWQTRMVPQGFPAIRKITGQRERLLRARLKDSTLDEWMQAMSALERSAFCRGENDRGWRADFDFLLQPKSFTKLLEGAYDH